MTAFQKCPVISSDAQLMVDQIGQLGIEIEETLPNGAPIILRSANTFFVFQNLLRNYRVFENSTYASKSTLSGPRQRYEIVYNPATWKADVFRKTVFLCDQTFDDTNAKTEMIAQNANLYYLIESQSVKLFLDESTEKFIQTVVSTMESRIENEFPHDFLNCYGQV